MYLAAFSFGRKWGNCEVFLKSALMGAEERGVEVRFYRLRDYELHNCSTCYYDACPASRDPHLCKYKDDAPFLIEEFLNSDGVLLAAPIYAISPNSRFFAFRDRVFGPKLDIARSAAGRPEQPWIKGRGKARAGGLISVGGALTENWTSLGLPSLYSCVFSPQTEVVDQMNIYGVASLGEAAAQEDYLARARQLGRNVADAMLTGDHSWRGDEAGVCPCCHLDTVTLLPGNKKVCCPVCGIYADVVIKDGALTFDWPDNMEYRQHNRQAFHGKLDHLQEIDRHKDIFAPQRERALQLLEQYKAYSVCEVPPPSKEKNHA